MTPIYQTGPSTTGTSILTGAITAIGGGLAEVAETEQAKDQFLKFSDVLAERGYVGDASIYRTMAESMRPNFLKAAITGQTTKRPTDALAMHALKIFSDDRENQARASMYRDQAFPQEMSLLKSDIQFHSSQIADLNRRREALLSERAEHTEWDGTDVAAWQGRLSALDKSIADAEQEREVARLAAAEKAASHRPGRLNSAISGGVVPGERYSIPDTQQVELPTEGKTKNAATPELLTGTSVTEPGSPEAPPKPKADISTGIRTEPFGLLTDLTKAVAKNAPGKEPVTLSNVDPEVAKADKRLADDYAAWKSTVNYDGPPPTRRKAFDALQKKYAPLVGGDRVFRTDSAAKAHQDYLDSHNIPWTSTTNRQTGEIIISPRSQTQASNTAITSAYKHPTEGVIYMEGKKIMKALPNGTIIEMTTLEDDNVRLAKFLAMKNSWQKMMPDQPMVPLQGPLTIKQILDYAKGSVAPSASSSSVSPSVSSPNSVEAWQSHTARETYTPK